MSGVVYVIDDGTSVRTDIRRRLEKAGYRLETFSSAQELFDHLPKPGCILLDAHLLNLNGLNLQTRLTELGSTLPVVLLASCPDIEGTVLAIKTGAKGAMAQHFNEHASKNAINGHHVHFASLTPREQQVFHLVVRGNVNKQIAHYLGTTVRTVKAHRKGVMEKMRARSLVELVSIAARLGELDE